MPPNPPAPSKHWLLKAEPETRLEKGKDVKFSIDDFARGKTTEWDGVRNHQAKGFLKDGMKKGQAVLFYHSNCKDPGVYGTATVLVEGHPDESAFDPAHPYYDPKSKRDAPTWFCPTLEYASTLAHPVTLAMLKHLASLAPATAAKERETMGLKYLSEQDHQALVEMPLVGKGRLSVQPVSDLAFAAVVRMGERGGWVAQSIKGPWVRAGEEGVLAAPESSASEAKEQPAAKGAGKKRAAPAAKQEASSSAAPDEGGQEEDGLRRSKRGRAA